MGAFMARGALDKPTVKWLQPVLALLTRRLLHLYCLIYCTSGPARWALPPPAGRALHQALIDDVSLVLAVKVLLIRCSRRPGIYLSNFIVDAVQRPAPRNTPSWLSHRRAACALSGLLLLGSAVRLSTLVTR
jgi:hypothetical protein